MVEFIEEDEDELAQKREREQLEQIIGKLRRQKNDEALIREKRAQQHQKQIQGGRSQGYSSMMNTELDYGNLGIVVNKFTKNLNINNLPNLTGAKPGHVVHEEAIVTNEKKEKEKRKKVVMGIQNMDDTALSGRPMSAKSGMTAITGGMTNAYTQFTAGNKTEFS